MKTTNLNEASAPANVRPSSVSKNSRLPKLDFALRQQNRRLPTNELLELLRCQAPQLLQSAEVVGKWVWIHLDAKPPREVTRDLSQFGFHWNQNRQTWQHPCGAFSGRANYDPHDRYGSRPAIGADDDGMSAPALKEDAPSLPGFDIVKPFRFPSQPYEYKVTALRECPTPAEMQECDTPDKIADYWRRHVTTHPYFNPDCECFVVLMLNTRRRVKGHYMVSIGTMDTILVHPREVFRLAIMTAAAAIVLTHNHPSGDPTPSEADIKVTRDLIRAGQLLKVEVIDHVVIGNPNRSSLRELGYFFQ